MLIITYIQIIVIYHTFLAGGFLAENILSRQWMHNMSDSGDVSWFVRFPIVFGMLFVLLGMEVIEIH